VHCRYDQVTSHLSMLSQNESTDPSHFSECSLTLAQAVSAAALRLIADIPLWCGSFGLLLDVTSMTSQTDCARPSKDR
jgi:hypothetical protein